MKFQIMSDLHLEFEGHDLGERFVKLLPVEADNLILAGDVFSKPHMDVFDECYDWFQSKWKRVFYVPGNHEYYGSDALLLSMKLKKHIRRCYMLTDKTQVLSTTLWFKNTVGANLRAKQGMADFYQIQNFDRWVTEEHERDLDYLTMELDFEKCPYNVVVTHHLPHHRSIHPRYGNSSLNQFFFSSDSEELFGIADTLFVHGHTHSKMDYIENYTRVVANPRGYPGETLDWNPAFTVEYGE